MLAVLNREIPVTEYAPKEIKRAVTGNGNAAKKQVAFMVEKMLQVSENRGEDATDALAVCLCHFHRMRDSKGASSVAAKSWSSFVEENPDRVIRD